VVSAASIAQTVAKEKPFFRKLLVLCAIMQYNNFVMRGVKNYEMPELRI
jgi:hypothetical protein